MASNTDSYYMAMGYVKKSDLVNRDFTGSTSTDSTLGNNNSLEQAVRDFKFYNRNTFFFGGVNYCRECNIIHPNDKCPRCEEPNFFFDDELLLRIDGLREAESIWREGWEMRIKVLEEEVKDLEEALKIRIQELSDKRNEAVLLASKADKLREQKKRLLSKIKELLSKPHLRHIIFDEEK